jgi:hypothetical protein
LADDDHTQYHNDTRGDIRYNTKAEITTFLAGKANTVHTHIIADVTGLQTALDNKVDDSQISAFGLTLVDDADAATARTTLGLANIAASGSATDLTAGTLPAARFDDTAHGTRAGGTLHAAATTGVAGFMSAADKTKLDGVATGANNYVHPNHTGDVTSVADGATTIANNVVTNAKLADVPTATFKGRTTAATGDPEDLTVAQAKTLLDLVGTNSGDQTITLTTDVTGSGTGSFATTIAANAVNNTKLNDMAANTVKVRADAATGDPSDLALGVSQLLGRGSSGNVAPIVLGTNLSMAGTTLNATGGGGGSGITNGQARTMVHNRFFF